MGEAAPEGQGRTEGVGLEQMGRGWPRGAGMDRGGGVGADGKGLAQRGRDGLSGNDWSRADGAGPERGQGWAAEP